MAQIYEPVWKFGLTTIRSGTMKKQKNLKRPQSVLDLLPTWSNKNLLLPNKSGCVGAMKCWSFNYFALFDILWMQQ